MGALGGGLGGGAASTTTQGNEGTLIGCKVARIGSAAPARLSSNSRLKRASVEP